MEFKEQRNKLTAAIRWTARLDMHEGISNHFSLAMTDDGKRFLMNPFGKHWSKVKSSDLLDLNVDSNPNKFGIKLDKTAWGIHGAIHRKVPHAKCVMHVHSKYATTLACLKNPILPPIDQNSMAFYNRVTYDDGYDGLGFGNEGERIASKLGNNSVILLGQHGVLFVGPNVADTFEKMYYFERACRTYILALQTGKELNIASHEVAEKTAQQQIDLTHYGEQHLKAICEVLGQEEPDYLN